MKNDEMIFKSNGDGTCILSKIGNYYDNDLIITTISPNGEKVVGIDAFVEMSAAIKKYKKIIIPEGIEFIEREAFEFSHIESVHISKTVNRIEYDAFYWCEELKEIKVDKDNEVYYAQNNCIIEKKTKKLIVGTNYSIIPQDVHIIGMCSFARLNKITNLKIPNSVKEIERCAFYRCKRIKNIELNEGLEIIGEYAFGCTNIEKLYIPSSVETIKDNIVSVCQKLKTIEVNENNKKYYSDGNCLIEKELKRIISGTNYSTIPKEIIEIGDFSFWYLCKIKKVVIPFGVKKIGMFAFYCCEHVKKVNLPESVEVLGQEAFECIDLKHIFVPKSVKVVDEDCFDSCHKLKSIEVEKENKYYYSSGNCIVEKKTNKLIIATNNSVIPDDVIDIADHVFYNHKYIKRIIIPNKVIHIGLNNFDCSYKLKELYIPKSVEVFEETIINKKCKIYYEGSQEEWNKIAPWYLYKGYEFISNNLTFNYKLSNINN